MEATGGTQQIESDTFFTQKGGERKGEKSEPRKRARKEGGNSLTTLAPNINHCEILGTMKLKSSVGFCFQPQSASFERVEKNS